jgi:hypothetical protein
MQGNHLIYIGLWKEYFIPINDSSFMKNTAQRLLVILRAQIGFARRNLSPAFGIETVGLQERKSPTARLG